MSLRYASEDVSPAPLNQPLEFEFAGRTAPNRFLKAAMTERLSSWNPTDFSARGIPTENLINLYRKWGEGGYGVILTGNVMMGLDQIEAPGNAIIPPDAPFDGPRFDAFTKLATETQKHGSLLIAQVNHPGRQVGSQITPNPVSASDIQLEGTFFGMTFAKPRAATKEDIQLFIKQWTHAAVYLYKAGFDGIQLHAAHGYLLAQFLAQSTNKRTDEYGGSLENRARLIVEIAQSIRKELPVGSGFVLSIKINSVEFQEGGFTTEEAKQLCQLLEQNEFDFVELSGGTYESMAMRHVRDSTKKRESFFIDFAEMITPALTKTRSYVTGGLKTVGAMVKALNAVDGVGLGRPATQEVNLPRDILEGKVQGAIEQALDQQDFGLTNVAAGTQMQQIGRNQQPIDFSDEKNVQIFQQAMGVWFQKLTDDAATMKLSGWVDLPEGPSFTH